MKVELNKNELEQAVKMFIDAWLPTLKADSIRFIKTRSVKDLKVIVETTENKEGE